MIQLVEANSSMIKCTTYQELIWQDSNVKASFPVDLMQPMFDKNLDLCLPPVSPQHIAGSLSKIK
jgi:hypothetical protein